MLPTGGMQPRNSHEVPLWEVSAGLRRLRPAPRLQGAVAVRAVLMFSQHSLLPRCYQSTPYQGAPRR